MRRTIVAAATLCAALLGGQAPVPQDATTVAWAALARGEYLAAVDNLAAAAMTPDGKVRDEQAFQSWTQVSPFITTELDPAVLSHARDRASPDPAVTSRLAAAVPHDAIGEIVRRARGTSIVILNEAHDSPHSRAFGLEVARALRPLGYSILAAEAFSNSPATVARPSPIEQLQKDRFVRQSTGFYTKDPVFAGFVREALAIGYKPVAYEQTAKQRPPGGGIEAREQAEADNLMSGIFAAQRTAKVLIYVGYSHAAEAPLVRSDGTKSEWMASRLKRATGIDPLTIDQTTLYDLSPLFAAASSRVGARSAVLFERGQPLVVGQNAGAMDLQVVHPRRTTRFGRPAWLAILGGESRAIPPEMLPTSGRHLVQAFAADAPADAVPLDQVLVTAASPVPSLIVPRGSIRFTVPADDLPARPL